jgi:hypothetical protein
MRQSLIGSVGGAGAPTPWAATQILSLFCLSFISRVFSYLLDYRKVMRSPFVSM